VQKLDFREAYEKAKNRGPQDQKITKKINKKLSGLVTWPGQKITEKIKICGQKSFNGL
jgi:hypothetical protein